MYEEGPGKSGEEKLPSNKKKSQGKAATMSWSEGKKKRSKKRKNY